MLVVLQNERGEQLIVILQDIGEGIVLGANKLSFAKEELNKHHFFSLAVEGKGIAVFAVDFDDNGLRLHHMFDLADCLQEGGGAFKLSAFRSGFHLCIEIF